jgi:hypothetical protein
MFTVHSSMVPTTKIDSFGSTINRKEVPRGFKKTKHKSTGLSRKTSHY